MSTYSALLFPTTLLNDNNMNNNNDHFLKFLMYHASSLKSCHLNVSSTCDIVTIIIPALLMKNCNHKETRQLANVTSLTGEGLEFKPREPVCRAHSPHRHAFFRPCFSHTGKFPTSSTHCTVLPLCLRLNCYPQMDSQFLSSLPPKCYLSLFQVSFKCQHLLDYGCCC